MNKKKNRDKGKSLNQLDDNGFSNFPINSDLVNIPIVTNMLNINSNVPFQENGEKKNIHNKK